MKKMPFYGQIKNGIWQWKAAKIFAAYCKEACKDGDYTLTLEKTVCSKTREQLGYYYAVIVPTAFNQMKADGNDSIVICVGAQVDGQPHRFKEIPLTEEVVDQMLKQIWAKNENVEVKSKADMTIEECSSLIDMSIKWCSQYLGCQIPPPEKTLT